MRFLVVMMLLSASLYAKGGKIVIQTKGTMVGKIVIPAREGDALFSELINSRMRDKMREEQWEKERRSRSGHAAASYPYPFSYHFTLKYPILSWEQLHFRREAIDKAISDIQRVATQ